MSDIDEMKLRRLDLTVLLIFLNLLRHRRGTAVSQQMGLTQSSTSHALKRLRAVFDDPLFLRKPHGLEPTAVALALEPQIRLAVQSLNGALSKGEIFDPRTDKRTLQIGASDLELAAFVPGLVSVLHRQAPYMRLSAQAVWRQQALTGLTDGAIDTALGYFCNLGDNFVSEHLLDQNYLVVMRAGHPLAGKDLDLDAFIAARHLVVSATGDLSGVVDQVLRDLGKTRHVAASVPLFFPALATLSCTDLISTLPELLARQHAKAFGLVTVTPPLPIRSFPVLAVRHRRNEKNALHLWVNSLLQRISAGGSSEDAIEA